LQGEKKLNFERMFKQEESIRDTITRAVAA